MNALVSLERDDVLKVGIATTQAKSPSSKKQLELFHHISHTVYNIEIWNKDYHSYPQSDVLIQDAFTKTRSTTKTSHSSVHVSTSLLVSIQSH